MSKPLIWLSSLGTGEWVCAVILPAVILTYPFLFPYGRGSTPREAYDNWEKQQ